jgi:uncharacterized protein (DUF983 family)
MGAGASFTTNDGDLRRAPRNGPLRIVLHGPGTCSCGSSLSASDTPVRPSRTAARPWLWSGVLPGVYAPRATTETALHHVVRAHLDRFLSVAAAATDGAGVPGFIEREFREFLGCGQLERGFARVRCDACRLERLVPFSCKARAACPSCGGRRMAEQAAHLVDAVLPSVPVPIYTATLGFYLGTTLAFSAWWTWAPLILLLVGYMLKAVDEERFLGDHLAAPRTTIIDAACRTASSPASGEDS